VRRRRWVGWGGVVHKYHNYYLMATEGERGGGWGKESHNDTVSQSLQPTSTSLLLLARGRAEGVKGGWMDEEDELR
jgi:hypothetical protein